MTKRCAKKRLQEAGVMRGRATAWQPTMALFLIYLAAVVPASADDLFRVTLLGTGTPWPSPERFGPSTLIEAGTHHLLIDAGRGLTIRLFQAHIPMRDIDAVFFTHYHSDHTVGLPDFWLTGWLSSYWGKRTTPLLIVGPAGARALMAGLRASYADDIRMRLADEHLSPAGIETEVREFNRETIVYTDRGLTVFAFKVDHGAAIEPAYGYRVDYHGHSVVLSGDTRYSSNLIAHAKGVDLLIHEVAAGRLEILSDPAMRRILDHHTSPAEVARVFAQAAPRMAVLSHIVLLASPEIPPLAPMELAAEVRRTYRGPLEIGEDLMSFDIAEAVTVNRMPH